MVTRYLNERMGKGYLNDRPMETHPARTAEEWREVVRLAREEESHAVGVGPVRATASVREEKAPPKSQPALPELSHEQRAAQRAMLRHACDWFEFHRLCANASCRKAKGCRGEPMACLRAGIPHVPESVRAFVRLMIEGQELGLDFEEAFEDAEELADGWAAWIAGLQAAGRAR